MHTGVLDHLQKIITAYLIIMGPYVLSGGPLIFNVILFKRKAVYTEGAGPVCKCTGQCTLEGYFIVLTVSINNLLQFLSRVFKGPPVNT